ncbi:ribonuclease H-like domain-containing protein [Mycena galericulata]|nr:ribonuclease H-like domain-containing protein [Mycena galericulata]
MSLQQYFHQGKTRQNRSHWHTYCKASCAAVGSTRGEKTVWITHLLGGQGKVACPHASPEARAVATAQREDGKEKTSSKKRAAVSTDLEPPAKKQQIQSTLTNLTFRRNDMPFGAAETAALQKQALRAIVSFGAPLRTFEDPEMKILFGMLRTTAPDIIPTGEVLGGRLLNEAAAEVEQKIEKRLHNQNVGLSSIKSYLLELVEVTALKKDGESLCELFGAMVDRVEVKHDCVVIYFTTDADGGSKKGRILLGRKRPWLILPSCWAHQAGPFMQVFFPFQLILGDYFKVNDMAAAIAEDATALIGWINNHGKVRKIFDDSQAIISPDSNAGRVIILAYLVANLTRWTTHFVAFLRLFKVRKALQLAVLTKRTAIIDAEVGAATSTEAARLTDDATKFCALIEDASFWHGLETVLGDLEPICLGTNINQKDSTRLDQVLLTIAGIFLHFADHPEPEVKKKMLLRLEKRWNDCDQPVFLLALILNPFERLSCFGPDANLNQLKCRNLLILLYRRMNSRPDNEDSAEQKQVKEDAVSKAFMQYLAGTSDFTDFDAEDWERVNVSRLTHQHIYPHGMKGNTDPIAVWAALADSKHLHELATFAIIILNIVANQAGCERTFSRTKIEQSDHRNRLGLQKIDKRTKIKAQILSEHQEQGLIKPRAGRKNHKSFKTLLSVPRYRDLLEDQDDEDPSERGRALVSSAESWRTVLAKWIDDARTAEREEVEERAELLAAEELENQQSRERNVPQLLKKLPTWKPMTLRALFGGAEKPRTRKPSARAMEEEEILMEALAEEIEDTFPDDGAIEVDSDEEYIG